MGVVYADASALVKVLVPEPETTPLTAFLTRHAELATSAITRVEVTRALLRTGARIPSRLGEIFDRVSQISVDGHIIARAALLEPAALRTLDAIHLATALMLDHDLEAVLTYDIRMADAARRHGIPVVAPA